MAAYEKNYFGWSCVYLYNNIVLSMLYFGIQHGQHYIIVIITLNVFGDLKKNEICLKCIDSIKIGK